MKFPRNVYVWMNVDERMSVSKFIRVCALWTVSNGKNRNEKRERERERRETTATPKSLCNTQNNACERIINGFHLCIWMFMFGLCEISNQGPLEKKGRRKKRFEAKGGGGGIGGGGDGDGSSSNNINLRRQAGKQHQLQYQQIPNNNNKNGVTMFLQCRKSFLCVHGFLRFIGWITPITVNRP